MSLQPLTEGPWFGPSVVSQEGDDGREAGEVRRAVAKFPVRDRRGVDAYPNSHLPLQEPEIKPRLPEVVADRPELLRVGRVGRFPSSEVDMARRQRWGEGLSRPDA